MAHIAELIGVTPAEVLGTCQLLRDVQAPAGRAATSSTCAPTSPACSSAATSCCTTPRSASASRPAAPRPTARSRSRTYECMAACTEAPCLQVNYRYFHRSPRTTSTSWSTTCGRRRADEVPPHGTLARVRQQLPRRPACAAGRNAEPAGSAARRARRAGARDRRCDAEAHGDGRSPTPSRSSPPASTSTTATPSTATWPPAATRACEAALAEAPAAGGRGGQGGQPARPRRRRLPRRRQVGLLPARRVAPLPRRQRRRVRAGHLQGPPPHGARPPPAHRGRAHRLLRRRRRPGVPLRAGRDGPRPGAHRRRRSTRPTPPATSARTSSAPTSPSTSSCTGAPAPTSSARRRRSSSSLEGNRGMPRLKPPYFPAAKGLYRQPTIVNNVETLANLPWIMVNGGGRLRRPRRRDVAGAPACSPCPATCSDPGVFEVEFGVTTFRDLIDGARYGGGIRDGKALKAFIPGGASAPVVLRGAPRPAARGRRGRRGRLDARLRRHRRDGRDHRRGAGLPGGSCGSSPASRAASARRAARARLAGEDPAAHPRRPRPPDRRRHAARRLRQHQPRRSPGRPRQTTICPLGPSAVSPIASAVVRFRDEFEAYVGGPSRSPIADQRRGLHAATDCEVAA